MELSHTDDQNQIQGEARRFLHDAFDSEVQRKLLRQRGQYDAAFWQACIDMGWTGAGVPEEYGGLGLGAIEVCLIAEECGRFIAAAPFLAPTYAASVALCEFGADADRAKFLPRISSGELTFALACFEDEDGLPKAPQTLLRANRVTGRKVAVAGAGAASHAIVYASGALALVDLSAPGVRREPSETIDNSRCTADIVFDDTQVIVLDAGDAFAAALRLLSIYATIAAFEQIGGAEAAMDRARNYANTREAFGQPIGKFQAVKHRIAEMYVAIELARGNALRAATGLREADFAARAAAARLTASHAFEFASAQSIQTHGAIGVTWEHDLHLYLRRARALALECGSRHFWEDVIVDALQGAHA